MASSTPLLWILLSLLVGFAIPFFLPPLVVVVVLLILSLPSLFDAFFVPAFTARWFSRVSFLLANAITIGYFLSLPFLHEHIVLAYLTSTLHINSVIFLDNFAVWTSLGFILTIRATLAAQLALAWHSTISAIVLATKHYLLSLSSRLSPFAQRDWPSDPTVLAPERYPLLPSPLTQRDLPSDPSFYKAYLCRIFSIQLADVIDLTDHIDRHRFIAAGGSGEVWEASWKGIDKNRLIGTPKALPMVVVKLVRLPPLRDEAHKDKRFKMIKRELLVWSKLHHPHILPLIGIARIEGDANLPAFISPWMENGNVMEFLKQNTSFPASRFLKDIIKGLHYLHTLIPVIVHGDIKGANVLINHCKEACLADFGLSRLVVDNTLWRTTATHANGTLRWMAPELIEGDMIIPTIATDIYAFGVTCYEILSRGSPFTAANDLAVMKKVTDGQRPTKIESCHSDEIWSVITRCWAHEPEDRPSTEETLKLVLQHDKPSKSL